jgi:hypothetical protein
MKTNRDSLLIISWVRGHIIGFIDDLVLLFILIAIHFFFFFLCSSISSFIISA